jgi:hypothetical protein
MVKFKVPMGQDWGYYLCFHAFKEWTLMGRPPVHITSPKKNPLGVFYGLWKCIEMTT